MEGNYYMKNKNTSITHNNGFEEHSWGTSSSTWPARTYGCSFCKREFKSAQALGGHMNVHRRDRARLRSSWLSSDHTPKPNPNPNNNNPTTTLFTSSSSPLSNDPLNNFSSSSSLVSPIYNPNYCLNSLSPSSNLTSITRSEDKKPRLIISTPQAIPLLKNPQNMEEINMVMMMSKKNKSGEAEEEKNNDVFKNKKEHNNITLELGIGLVNHKEQQKLDLELRL